MKYTELTNLNHTMTLPSEIWALIYRFLETKEDRKNLTLVSRGMHDNPDIKLQLTKMVVPMDGIPDYSSPEQDFTSFTLALQTYPSVNLKRIVLLDGPDQRFQMAVEQADERATFPFITELVIKGFNTVLDFTFLIRHFPHLTSLSMESVCDDLVSLGDLYELRELVFDANNSYRTAMLRSPLSYSLKGCASALSTGCPLLTTLVLPFYIVTDDDVAARFSSLKNLRFSGIESRDLLNLKRDLERDVYPGVRCVDIDNITLFKPPGNDEDSTPPNVYYSNNPVEYERLLGDICEGASLFSGERRRARLSRSFGCMWYYVLDDDYVTLDHADAAVYIQAFEKLMQGGMCEVAHLVRDLHLDCMYQSAPFIDACERYFTTVQSVSMGNYYLGGT